MKFVSERKHVSVAEIIDKFQDPGGNYTVVAAPNVFIWVGLSKELHDCILDAVNNQRITATPTTLLVYMVDGRALRMPLAKKAPKAGYKKPHWLPVVFNLATEKVKG